VSKLGKRPRQAFGERRRRLLAFLRAEGDDRIGATQPALSTAALIRRIVVILRPQRRMLSLVAVITVANAGLAMVTPLLSRLLFDKALFPRSGGANLGLLYRVLALMAVATMFGSAFSVALTYLNNAIGQRVVRSLRERLYAQITRQSLRFFSTSRTGELQARVLGDIDGILPIVSGAGPDACESAVMALAAGVVMFALSWPLAIVSILILAPVLLIARHTAHVRRRIAGQARESAVEMSVMTEQTLSTSGALLAKVFDRQGSQLERFNGESARLSRLMLRSAVLNHILSLGMQMFNRFAPFSLYLVAGILISSGGHDITAGTLVAFLTLQSRLLGSLQTIAETGISLTAASVYFDRIFEYLDLEPDIRDSPGARELPPSSVRGAVSLHNVWFSYQSPPGTDGPDQAGRLPVDSETNRYWALQDVSLEIRPGQLAAIVGPTGSGKTTLSYLMARLYEATRGTVAIDGNDVRDLRLSSLSAAIGMVTQESYILHASIRENLAYARPDATDEEIEAAARAALLHDRIVDLPDGYESLVGERGYRLSGGERQRLALARVLLKDPPILILDEGTSALDTRSERMIQQSLVELAADRTRIVIAHRLSTIVAADIIFVVDLGKIVEQGSHPELLEQRGLYAELYGSGVLTAGHADRPVPPESERIGEAAS
jgi:ATP-binding cassette subfamily B protein